MPRVNYPVVIHSDDGRNFGASFVDFPIHAGGDSVEAALAEAEAIAAEVIPEEFARGDLPRPTAIADIPAEIREGAYLVSVAPVLVPGRSKVVSVTFDLDLLRRIDEVAPNRSAFLAEAARAKLAAQ